MHTIAGIDVGSNAIRLLISNVENVSLDKKFRKVAFLRVPIRLGEDVFRDGRVGSVKKKRLCHAFQGFSHIMKAYDVQEYRAYATSAMREAENGEEIVEAIYRESDIDVRIISGQQEADIIYSADELGGSLERNGKYLYVDVGGGSTEIIVYADGQKKESCSFRLGTVRMLNEAVRAEDRDFFKRRLSEIQRKYSSLDIIASGGNINKVHKLLGKREKEPLRSSELKTLLSELEKRTYEERIRDFKLNPYRADVIVPALSIFLSVGKACRAKEILVPKVGLVDGIIHQIDRDKTAREGRGA
jgi:exopolyphosphatase/guanosine-5'-triphosphate,3'-diphosphate pyrophosphatase